MAYAAHRAASPYTVLELVAPRAGDGYAAAGAALARWRRTGVLRTDEQPGFYLYEEHELRGRVPAVQRGVLAAVRLEPPGSPGALLPHEHVDLRRVTDRLDRLRAAPLDVSPVFALYEGGPPGLRALLDRPKRTPPLAAFTDEQGVDHRVWKLGDPDDVTALSRGLAGVTAVIADGHHRWAAGLAYLEERRAAGERDPCSERTLAYLVDAAAHGPRVEAIHRIVRPLPPDTESRLAAAFDIDHRPPDAPALLRAVHHTAGVAFALLHGTQAWLLRARDPGALRDRLPPARSQAWRRLDAAVFEHALMPLLGADLVIEPRIDVRAAAAAVRNDPRTGLFLLRPPSAATVLALAEAGEPLPPKSTSFRPKPRTGLVMRLARA
jgi:uncharacterized protein (DUF1015 family)